MRLRQALGDEQLPLMKNQGRRHFDGLG